MLPGRASWIVCVPQPDPCSGELVRDSDADSHPDSDANIDPDTHTHVNTIAHANTIAHDHTNADASLRGSADQQWLRTDG